MAPDREPGRGGGAEAGGALEEAARTSPRRTVQEPDWAAPRGPRTESAGAGPAPAHRLASQSPGPVPCLSDAGLSLPVMHKPHPLRARNPAPPTACQASPPPGKPKPSEAPPASRFGALSHTLPIETQFRLTPPDPQRPPRICQA